MKHYGQHNWKLSFLTFEMVIAQSETMGSSDTNRTLWSSADNGVSFLKKSYKRICLMKFINKIILHIMLLLQL